MSLRASYGLAGSLVVLTACGGPELYLENDLVSPGPKSDRDYTHGTRLQYTFDAEEAPRWINPAINLLNPFNWDQATEFGLTVGQQIFTPGDLRSKLLIEDDRPYAGWLFAGIGRDAPYFFGAAVLLFALILIFALYRQLAAPGTERSAT